MISSVFVMGCVSFLSLSFVLPFNELYTIVLRRWVREAILGGEFDARQKSVRGAYGRMGFLRFARAKPKAYVLIG